LGIGSNQFSSQRLDYGVAIDKVLLHSTFS
jgi:hypothetical protein